MGIEDFRLKLDVLEHDKIREFIEGFDELEQHLGAVAFLGWIRLIIYAARNATDGHLTIKPRRIKTVARWPRQAEELIDALIDTELMKKTPEGYQLHDWADHQPYIAATARRIATAKKGAVARWEKHKGKQDDNAGSNAGSNAVSEKSNAPTVNLNLNHTLNHTNSPHDALSEKSNAVSEKSNALSIARGIKEPEDFVGATIEWYNGNVVPPFVLSQSKSRTLRNAILRASDSLREINGAANVGHEFAEMAAYLQRAKTQYEFGGIPCKWGLLNLCKEENIIKVLDGTFEPVEPSPDDWAEAMKAKERVR